MFSTSVHIKLCDHPSEISGTELWGNGSGAIFCPEPKIFSLSLELLVHILMDVKWKRRSISTQQQSDTPLGKCAAWEDVRLIGVFRDSSCCCSFSCCSFSYCSSSCSSFRCCSSCCCSFMRSSLRSCCLLIWTLLTMCKSAWGGTNHKDSKWTKIENLLTAVDSRNHLCWSRFNGATLTYWKFRIFNFGSQVFEKCCRTGWAWWCGIRSFVDCAHIYWSNSAKTDIQCKKFSFRIYWS